VRKVALAFLLVFLLGVAQAADKAGPKVFISVDMEGIWGVVQGSQTSSSGADYGVARKWMVDDTNAVIAGLFEAGAGAVVVNDSHGSMRNIIADELDSRASLISGSPKPLSMMQGIDDTFDACIFVGYHARAGTAEAVLDHTYSSATIRSIKVNGREMPELGINAAIAGYFNVPVIMLTGDTETCAQAKSILGEELVTVAVKDAVGRYAAANLPQEVARKRLKEAAKEALVRTGKMPIFKPNAPYKFELEFLTSAQTEMPTLVPQVKKTGARGIAFSSADYLEGFKLMRALIALAGIS
jgi:D-amino peptidase